MAATVLTLDAAKKAKLELVRVASLPRPWHFSKMKSDKVLEPTHLRFKKEIVETCRHDVYTYSIC